MYKGTIASGQVVAIKRAQQGSLQGALEFKTEIELLSRINHKNVVELVGFCYEQGEQMLVYEYVPNGTLNENLAGTAIHFLASVSNLSKIVMLVFHRLVSDARYIYIFYL